MGGRGSEVQILSPRPLPPDIGGSRDAASVFVCGPGRAPSERSALRPFHPRPHSSPVVAGHSASPREVVPRMIALLHPLAAVLARALPARWAYALARLCARGFWHSGPARRRAVLANLSRVAPGLDAAARHALALR